MVPGAVSRGGSQRIMMSTALSAAHLPPSASAAVSEAPSSRRGSVGLSTVASMRGGAGASFGIGIGSSSASVAASLAGYAAPAVARSASQRGRSASSRPGSTRDARSPSAPASAPAAVSAVAPQRGRSRGAADGGLNPLDAALPHDRVGSVRSGSHASHKDAGSGSTAGARGEPDAASVAYSRSTRAADNADAMSLGYEMGESTRSIRTAATTVTSASRHVRRSAAAAALRIAAARGDPLAAASAAAAAGAYPSYASAVRPAGTTPRLQLAGAGIFVGDSTSGGTGGTGGSSSSHRSMPGQAPAYGLVPAVVTAAAPSSRAAATPPMPQPLIRVDLGQVPSLTRMRAAGDASAAEAVQRGASVSPQLYDARRQAAQLARSLKASYATQVGEVRGRGSSRVLHTLPSAAGLHAATHYRDSSAGGFSADGRADGHAGSRAGSPEHHDDAYAHVHAAGHRLSHDVIDIDIGASPTAAAGAAAAAGGSARSGAVASGHGHGRTFSSAASEAGSRFGAAASGITSASVRATAGPIAAPAPSAHHDRSERDAYEREVQLQRDAAALRAERVRQAKRDARVAAAAAGYASGGPTSPTSRSSAVAPIMMASGGVGSVYGSSEAPGGAAGSPSGRSPSSASPQRKPRSSPPTALPPVSPASIRR